MRMLDELFLIVGIFSVYLGLRVTFFDPIHQFGGILLIIIGICLLILSYFMDKSHYE